MPTPLYKYPQKHDIPFAKGCLSCFIIYVIIFLFGLFVYKYYISLPVVKWSVSKDKCISVVSDDMEYDCDNLPVRYNKVPIR
jgi:hypothetical protein